MSRTQPTPPSFTDVIKYDTASFPSCVLFSPLPTQPCSKPSKTFSRLSVSTLPSSSPFANALSAYNLMVLSGLVLILTHSLTSSNRPLLLQLSHNYFLSCFAHLVSMHLQCLISCSVLHRGDDSFRQHIKPFSTVVLCMLCHLMHTRQLLFLHFTSSI